MRYFTLDDIHEKHARYNLIFGERSNGKTYAVLYKIWQDFLATGYEGAVVRRYREDFVGKKGSATAFNSLMCNGEGVNVIERDSKGRWCGVEFWGDCFYLLERDQKTRKAKRTNTVLARAFNLSESDRYKGTSFPAIHTILFDEFITRKPYLNDEFILFEEVVSTIARGRDDVTIYMCANTVNKWGCPYWREMGLRHVREMEQGQIDVYKYGQPPKENVIAVQYAEPTAGGKASDVFFIFDNPKLKMITTGAWELDIYPHCPCKYKPKDVLFNFFIIFEEQTLHAEVVTLDGGMFVFVHQKTTPIKDESNDLVYTTEADMRYNWSSNLLKPRNNIERRILQLFANEKFFYQDNEVGEVVRGYIQACKTK